MRTKLIAGAAVLAAAGGGAAAAEAFHRGTVPPPYRERCALEIRAYEDHSASLYCEGRRKPFAGVDAESGRLRFYVVH